MNKNSRIFIAGHRGLVGSAIYRKLKEDGYNNLITWTHAWKDLTQQRVVDDIFFNDKPEYVFLAAAKVGGILANEMYPADFLYENIAIQTNMLQSACKYKVKKLLFLGSSCIYPKDSPQPMKETDLFYGPLEPTNEAYAVAKLTGIKMCQAFNKQYGTNFISVIPPNIYGPCDHFDLETSHVLPTLIKKFTSKDDHVMLWGSGRPYREFLYSNDLADVCVFLMNNYNETEPINVGTGLIVTVHELADLIIELTEYHGDISWDLTKPDGMMWKQLDVSKIHAMGWKAKMSLVDGITETIKWYTKKFNVPL